MSGFHFGDSLGTQGHMTDWQLLYQYAHTGSESAFAELVRRHSAWVYGVALRGVRDAQLAEDVTQAAFLVLARKAGALPEGTIVAAWLFRTTRLAAAETLRREMRRRRREREAAMISMRTGSPIAHAGDGPAWAHVAPAIDRAVERLGADDRRVVMLRYYGGKSFADVGVELGVTAEAARKRSTRAIERLRQMLSRSEVALSAVTFEALLLSNLVPSPPAALASGIATACVKPAAATASLSSMETIVLKTLFWAKVKAVGGATAAAALVGAIVILGCAKATSQQPAASAALTPPIAPPAASATPNDAGATLDAIVAAVSAAERKVKGLYVKEFNLTSEESTPQQPEWHSTPERYSGSAWFDMSDPKSVYGWTRARARLTHAVMRWEQGRAPWFDQEKDISFDGERGREIGIRSGIPGEKMTRDNEAFVRLDPPPQLANPIMDTASGLSFTLWWTPGGYGADAMKGRVRRPSFAEMVASAKQHGIELEVTRDPINGVDAIRLRPKSAIIATWLDPARGYSLIRRELLEAPGGKVRERLEVTSLVEIAPGVWYPTEATIEEPMTGRDGRVRRHYRAAGATANDANWKPTLFNPLAPPGYLVTEYGKGTRDYKSHVVLHDATTRPIRTGELIPPLKPADVEPPK